jgi:NADPH-dependent ferric siderophore reductase
MRRITFAGESLAQFPPDCAGGYIKLMFDNSRQGKPSVRTYTIRHHRESKREIDVDFAMHADEGLASNWAENTKPGDLLMIGGPGPKKSVDLNADWFFLVGDMSSLPALSVNLESLPATATGYVVIELLHEDDKQEIRAPAGMQIQWLVKENGALHTARLVESVRSKAWLAGKPAVWAASEFDTMKALRRYFKEERGLPKTHTYFSSYWKNGLRESEHVIVKRRDSEVQKSGA